MLGAASVAQSNIGQTLLVAAVHPGSPALEPLLSVSARAVTALEARGSNLLERLGTESAAAIRPSLDAAVEDARRLLESISLGEIEAADDAAATLTAAFETLIAQIAAEREVRSLSIAEAAGEAGKVATASRFMVAIGVPGLMLLILVTWSRRRRRQIQLDADLAREREVNRSKDQLIANISHELRTPLTGIYSASLAIEDSGFDPDLTRELNGIVVDQSSELQRMVEDLLASAQADLGRLSFQQSLVDIRSEAEAVAREFARFEKPTHLDVEAGVVRADGMRTRQVLRNLVANAHRHGGDHISIVGRSHGDDYVIAVVDDGAGVPESLVERLFTPFIHQGDRPLVIGSVGLGLSICRILAEGMGGSIQYRRVAGRTCFALHLPMATGMTDESDDDRRQTGSTGVDAVLDAGAPVVVADEGADHT